MGRDNSSISAQTGLLTADQVIGLSLPDFGGDVFLGSRGVMLGTAQGLAVDGDHASNPFPQTGDPGRESPLKGLRVEQTVNLAEGPRLGNAVFEGKELPWPSKLFLPEQLNLIKIIGPARQPHKRRQKHLVQRIK